MENSRWKVIQRKPILKGTPILCTWPSTLRPYPSLAHLVKNELEKFAKEQQSTLSNDNDETPLNQPETQATIEPDCQPELSESNTAEASQSNPQQLQSDSQQAIPQPSQPNSELPQSISQPPQSDLKLPQSNSQQTECTNPQPPLVLPELNPPLPPSASTHFFHFLRLMQMFPETHPATLHTVMTMSGNKFFVAIDKLLFAQRSRNEMMSKTIRSSGMIREKEATLFGMRSHSNRGRPPKTQRYEPCSSVSNNPDLLGPKSKYLVQTSTFKTQKRPINNIDNKPNQKHPCLQIENNDILEMYYDPSLDEETFEDLIEHEDSTTLNEETFKGFIENNDVLMMEANEEPKSVVVDISDDESK